MSFSLPARPESGARSDEPGMPEQRPRFGKKYRPSHAWANNNVMQLRAALAAAHNMGNSVVWKYGRI